MPAVGMFDELVRRQRPILHQPEQRLSSSHVHGSPFRILLPDRYSRPLPQNPWNFGGRFSRKACTASLASWVWLARALASASADKTSGKVAVSAKLMFCLIKP